LRSKERETRNERKGEGSTERKNRQKKASVKTQTIVIQQNKQKIIR
jgi:hypothetical protein